MFPNKAQTRSQSQKEPWIPSRHLKLLLLGALVLLVVVHNTICFQQAFPSVEMDKNAAVVRGASYDMAYDESYGFFEDITDESWLRRKRWAREFNKDLEYNQRFLNFYKKYFVDNSEPYFACPEKVRLGGIGDGPKWICNIHRLKGISERWKGQARANPNNNSQQDADKHGCLVYSIGSAGDFRFENSVRAAVGEGECEIHTFDPTGDFSLKMKNPDGKSFYHMWGLKSAGVEEDSQYSLLQSNASSTNGPYYGLAEIMRRLEHEDRIVDLFKIDCEGCEWSVFDDIAAQTNIRQLMIEVHNRPYSGPEKTFQLFETFAKNGLIMYSKELNSRARKAVEFSFIRLKHSFLDLPPADK
mmetsp:Transcript_13873/g.39489  ORF Transcript_13873/g.39489 Transcript_13873/m.39489 type:complete len:357 (-) Transcript_13873:163-1233(-)